MGVQYVVAEGLGNIIQTTPAFNFLLRHGREPVVRCHRKFLETAAMVYKGRASVAAGTLPGRGVVRSCSVGSNGTWPWRESEVVVNLKLAGCSSPRSEDKAGFCGWEDCERTYDILLCDGHKKGGSTPWAWEAKSYLRWKELAAAVSKHYSVASTGLPSEYVEGTANETGIGLGRALGLLRNCRLLVCNDTGLYHAANVFGVRSIVLFTMTDRVKNYDPEFHRHSTVLARGMACQPCQFTTARWPKHHWIHNRESCGWACRDVNPGSILQEIRKALA